MSSFLFTMNSFFEFISLPSNPLGILGAMYYLRTKRKNHTYYLHMAINIIREYSPLQDTFKIMDIGHYSKLLIIMPIYLFYITSNLIRPNSCPQSMSTSAMYM